MSSSSLSFDSSSSLSSAAHDAPPIIKALPPLPTYQIDLSLPPSQRHTTICHDFRTELAQFSELYSTILGLSGYPRLVGAMARLLLREVHEREETLEIKAIAKDTGLRLSEVVAYNTLLDVFSGCSSGGVRAVVPQLAEEDGRDEEKHTMLHFRNLDWEMDILRDLLIRVEYLRDGKVIARAVTYAGYTGVLTGVREGLSISLNYRRRIRSRSSSMKHYLHYLAVLLGSRSSTPSMLRSLLLSPGPAPSLDDITQSFQKVKSGSCYLTFCSPNEVLILEKDLNGITIAENLAKRMSEAKNEGKEGISSNLPPVSSKTGPQNREEVGVQRSREFAVVTNHDHSSEAWSPEEWARTWKQRRVGDAGGASKIMGDSMERKRCLVDFFNEMERVGQKVTLDDVKELLRMRPVRNEMTHFSCIMDPSLPGGGMVWVEGCEAV